MQMTWLWLCKCQWHVEKMISKCWTYQILMLLLVLLSDNLAVTTAPVSALYTSIFPLVVHGTKSTVAAEPCFRLFFVAAHLVWCRVFFGVPAWVRDVKRDIGGFIYCTKLFEEKSKDFFVWSPESSILFEIPETVDGCLRETLFETRHVPLLMKMSS